MIFKSALSVSNIKIAHDKADFLFAFLSKKQIKRTKNAIKKVLFQKEKPDSSIYKFDN